MEIGTKIKKRRENNDLTQDELAEKLGISKSALWNYENNKRDIPLDILIKCSNILDENFIEYALEFVNVSSSNNKKADANTNLDEEIEKKKNIIKELNDAIKKLKNLKTLHKKTIEIQEELIKNQEEMLEIQRKNINDGKEILAGNPAFMKELAKMIFSYAKENNLIKVNPNAEEIYIKPLVSIKPLEEE